MLSVFLFLNVKQHSISFKNVYSFSSSQHGIFISDLTFLKFILVPPTTLMSADLPRPFFRSNTLKIQTYFRCLEQKEGLSRHGIIAGVIHIDFRVCFLKQPQPSSSSRTLVTKRLSLSWSVVKSWLVIPWRHSNRIPPQHSCVSSVIENPAMIPPLVWMLVSFGRLAGRLVGCMY